MACVVGYLNYNLFDETRPATKGTVIDRNIIYKVKVQDGKRTGWIEVSKEEYEKE